MQSERWLEGVWKTGAAPNGTWIVLRGSSMEPTYADGDNLLVKSLQCTTPKVRTGDVVVVRRGERLVTHRLVNLIDGIATTKGDACARVDPPISRDALLGRVVGVRRRRNILRICRLLKTRMRTYFYGYSGRGTNDNY